MRCRKCGAELNDDELFCHRCGAPVKKRNDEELRNNKGYENDKKPRKNNTAVVVLLVILISLVLLVAAAVGSYMFVNKDSSVIKESLDRQNSAASATYAVQTAAPKETEKTYTAAPRVTANPSSGVPDSDPQYSVYTDPELKFSCAYPKSFEAYIDNTTSGRYTVRNEDKSATLRICAEKNDAKLTIEQSLSTFTSKTQGDVEYQKTGSTYYAVRVNDGSICYYKYLVSKDGYFYWFEFNYPTKYQDIYDGYVQHIYSSFTVK
jgi:hypothetical protein